MSSVAGIGIDIERVDRFRTFEGDEGASFLQSLFTEHELAYCMAKSDPAPHLAARFCAKEALRKALGRESCAVLPSPAIEVRNAANGAPFLVLHHEAFSHLHALISLSHTRNSAIAIVIVME